MVGTKDSVVGAVTPCAIPPPEPINPAALIQTVLGELPKVTLQGHSLGITLMSLNGYVHPAVMYGEWKVCLKSVLVSLQTAR